jgi:hypothetical protein
MGTLPEAKIGPVKRMPKREMDSCRLYVLNGKEKMKLDNQG